jgi:hypothetical protein
MVMNLKQLVVFSFLASVGATPLHAAEPTPAQIAIELVPGAQWEVRYALPAPATELRFVRVDAKGNRAAGWAPVDPAFAITLVDGEEVVRRSDGAAFDHAAFRMAPM